MGRGGSMDVWLCTAVVQCINCCCSLYVLRLLTACDGDHFICMRCCSRHSLLWAVCAAVHYMSCCYACAVVGCMRHS